MSQELYSPSTYLVLQVRCDHLGAVRVHLESWDDDGENSACTKTRLTAAQAVRLFDRLAQIVQELEHPMSGELP